MHVADEYIVAIDVYANLFNMCYKL